MPIVSLDKDQETRLYKFTKEAKSNRGHKAKRRSISKEGCSYFSPYRNTNEGNAWVPRSKERLASPLNF